jgi:hypothetical protein
MKNEIMQILNELSQAINAHYGYVKLEGSNYGEPVINSGPCGPFANTFFLEWNRRFDLKVTICFIMEIAINDCYHVLIRLPNGQLYDGGIGVHDKSHYDARFKIEDMKVYDLKLLDERSHGLERAYPRFCPNFNITELRDLIEQYLDEASKYV